MKRRLPPPAPSRARIPWIPVIVVGLIALDLIYIHRVLERIEKTAFYQSGQVPIPSVSRTPPQTDGCPAQCSQLIADARQSMEDRIQSLPLNVQIPKIGGSSEAKEYFVTFGSGSSSSGDWQTVPGLEASVDSGNYPGLKRVNFEASLLIPTGNQTAYVRLYNATDKHPVWGSDLSLDGGTGKLLISGPITLDKGNKLYQVQMKTSLKYEAKLNQARLRILLR